MSDRRTTTLYGDEEEEEYEPICEEEPVDADFNLAKGLKIWLAFNRETYFCLRLTALMFSAGFLLVSLSLSAAHPVFAYLLYIYACIHSLDIVGYILDLCVLTTKDLRFYLGKLVIDGATVLLQITAQVIVF